MGILCYHTVDPGFQSRLSLTPAQFEEHCRWLAADRDVVDLSTAVALMDERGRLPRGVVALTFDDGLEGVYRYAGPTLVDHGLPATVFMVSDTLTGSHPDVDWIDGVPGGRLRPMSVEQMQEMAAAGVEFGSHSSRHFVLPHLGRRECEEDLQRSRAVLEQLLERPVTHLAYPRGRHDAVVRSAAASAGFRYGFSLPEGRERISDLAVPRVGVYAHNHLPTVRIKSWRGFVPVRMNPVYPAARSLVRAARRSAVGGRSVAAPQTSSTSDEAASPPTAEPGSHVAYIMSRFPKITETFVLNEILELQGRGVRVDVYPLLRERQPVAHPEADALVRRARFQPFLSPSIVSSQFHYLRRAPRVYLRMVRDVLRWTTGSLNFLVGAVGILPKAVHMSRMMELDGVQHVHCHFATHPAVAGLIVQRLSGIPFSFTAHGSDLHVDRRMLSQKVAEARFVVTISEYNRRVILDECTAADGAKVHVVHSGVDVDAFHSGRPPDLGQDGPLRVVCIGTLHEVKGQRHLVDACRILRDRGVAVTCEFIGDGPDARALRDRVRDARLEDRVEFRGPLPRPRVIEALHRGHVLVAPSVPTRRGKREGIPVVLMEAMAMARPVVASRLSGIPELVEDGVSGILVPPGDAVALADAMARLAADAPAREALGRAGRRTVEEAFNVSTSVSQLHALFGHRAREHETTQRPR